MSAVVAPTLNLEDFRSLPMDASTFSAEYEAILLALELIEKLPKGNYIIYSDSVRSDLLPSV